MRRPRLVLLLVLGMLTALLPLGAAPAAAADDHLLMTEIVVTPTEGEFVEIHNPTASAIDLTDYYFTDATFAGGGAYYYNIVTGLNAGGGGFADFHSRFPAGSSIAPGEYQTISLSGSIGFIATYGFAPTYELFEDDAVADGVPDMLEALPNSISGQGGLSNSGEFVVIYTWDGASDLVTDVDYAVWGDQNEAVDKTGVAVDGPDADSDASAYADETPIASQAVIAGGSHANGQSWQRNDLTEGAEVGTGGNGIGGDDETSEDTNVTWSTAVPTPGAGAAPPPLPDIWINEVDADTPSTDTAEFIELYDGGVGNAPLDGYSVILFNGSDNLSYTPAFDLDGFSTDADGYFVIGSVPGADIDVSPGGSGWLQNGADAVALIAGDAADFPNDTAIPTSGVVDALVYDTNDADDAELLPLLNAGQAQINEDGNGDKDNHSNQRCPDGSGDLRNTDTYTQFLATPRTENCVLPPLTPDIVINEIMNNPAAVADGAGEWFELYNASPADVDIEGWTISDDDTDSHVIANGSPLVVPAGGYLVLGNNTDSLTNGGASVSYSYGGSWFLANGGDEVVLVDADANEVDRVVYDGGPDFPDLTGASMALIDPALDNNDGANWCQSGTAFGDGDLGSPGAVNDCIPPDPTDYKIHEIQGDGTASPKVGEIVTVEAVVVGDYQQGDLYPSAEYDTDIDGYFIQEEDSDADGNASTSEGIFVRDNDNAVNVGDVVRVTGTVAESFGLTRIESVSLVEVLTVDPAPTVTPATVTLPVASINDLEAFEGMSVLLPQALVISEYFNFDRFGEMVLTTERAAQPTAVFPPGSVDAANLADLNSRSRISLDDGRTASNPDPAIHPNGAVFDLTNTFRGGDTVQNVSGVMDFAFGSYKVQPTAGADYVAVNARPTSPDPVGGDLTVATFNVLNYFTTLDDSGSICGPEGDQGCRGADNAEEFTRQRDKIISAIVAIDADVVGLMEIENDSADVAVNDLVAGLNDATAPGTYAGIATGPVGPDAIRVALVYQPASVTPYGAHAVLEGEFLDPNNLNDDKNRAALAQSFLDNANGGVFTVAVNHLKSKGSGCGAGDDDPEQGSCNLTRTLAAEILADWLQTDPTGSGDSDYLIIGDLNSYDMEDPISALKARGYTDLILRDVGPEAYSYVFSGQWGYLDYIMANAAAASQVTGTTVWHINADEPDILDYDTSFKKDAQDALYEPNAFRSSDHDPVIAGLDVTVTPMQAKEHSLTVLAGLLPTGNKRDDNRINKAIKNIGDSLNPDYWVDDFHLSDKGKKVFNNEKTAVKSLMNVRTVDVDGVIAALVEADEVLAGTAIADAIEQGGDADDIARAQHEMEEAAEDVALGRPDWAIDHYRKAWQWAQKALEEAPPRFATFNASLNRFNAGDLINDLSDPFDAQAQAVAEIIQRNRPDVLLVNEFDYDVDGVAAGLFQDNYLSIGQNGADPIVYPYRYVAASNTGVPSGFDFDNNGSVGGGNDAYGFGFFEGQFAFVVYSMHPIKYNKIRTFQNFLWKDMPGALLPDDPATPDVPADWYSPEELDVFRLSSKNHVDVPIRIHGETIHFLVSHPTPPVFDGPEDRNGTRNHDEIRFWADYATGGKTARYIYDDNGKKGGLSNNARFVIAGDLNSDPLDGDSIPGAVQQLLEHPRVNVSQTPSSLGGPEQALLTGGLNLTHLSDPAFDTADFNDAGPGNLRADYVLPSSNLGMVDSAVFWPEVADPLFPLVGTFPFPSSDHRLVWVDVDVHGPDHDDDDYQQPT